MPSFKPAYLIHGDDHGRIAERRSRLRALAEAESGAQGVELFEGDAAAPDAVARALNAMTFAFGRRFIIVDGAERWKDKELDALEASMAAIAPDTTVAFFAREDSRAKAPGRLHDAVRKAGGDISAEESVKPWELPKWVIAQARELGLTLEPDAARALVRHVGDRQQRLLRELEKLSLMVAPETRLDAAQIEELTAPSAERKAWSLADALVAGEAAPATRIYLSLRAQGERVPGLLYWMAQRVRSGHQIARALDAGEAACADQAQPADAVAGRRWSDRGRSSRRLRQAAPGARGDRRPRARLSRRRRRWRERGHGGAADDPADRRGRPLADV